MTVAQMAQYDLFLDENDWDIYYWATQDDPVPNAATTAHNSVTTQGHSGHSQPGTQPQQESWQRSPRAGEWAQTVGTFKPAYRPVPARWKDSEVLKMLRAHVEARRADEVVDQAGDVPKGIAFMPKLFDIDKAGRKS
jgi:succinate dehydrogenase assembly factor 2